MKPLDEFPVYREALRGTKRKTGNMSPSVLRSKGLVRGQVFDVQALPIIQTTSRLAIVEYSRETVNCIVC